MQTFQVEIVRTVCSHALSICYVYWAKSAKLPTLSTLSKLICFSVCKLVDVAAALLPRSHLPDRLWPIDADMFERKKFAVSRPIWLVLSHHPEVETQCH